MNSFSKKTDLTLLIVSTAAFIVSVVIIICSTYIFTSFSFLKDVVEKRILSRAMKPEELYQIIMPLIEFPIFFVILFNALFFVKFSNRSKIILIGQFFIAAAVLTSVCAFTRCIQYMNSDMASEIMLAKECFTHKTFWPRSWYYSTEFRLLNTQLVAAPLFAFTSNWITVKAVSAIILCFALPLSLLFLLKIIDVKTLWVKLLCALLIFLPWSGQMWDIVQFGNYYIPHIAISFIYVGLFISLAYSDLSLKKRKIFAVLFFALAFISGVSGIRYILNFQLPIAFAIIALAVYRSVDKKERFSISDFFLKNKPVFYASINIILGGLGYIANTILLRKLFVFMTAWFGIRLNTIGAVSLADIQRTIFEIFGYSNDEVLLLGPAGMNNVIFYAAFLFFVVCFILCMKRRETESKQIFLIIAATIILLNAFVIVHTEYVDRFFIPALIYCVPCFALFLESRNLSSLKKYLLGVSVSVVLVAGSFISYTKILTSNGNEDKRAVCRFLYDNYDFGYASFWNANIFTFMTDGKVEVGTILTDNHGRGPIPTLFASRLWLAPERYWQADYKANEPIFFLVSQYEYEMTPEHKAFKTGRQVYSDDFYRVFEFENKKAFIDGF